MSIDSTVIMISHKKEHVKYFARLLYFKDGNICLDINGTDALTNPLIKNFFKSEKDFQK